MSDGFVERRLVLFKFLEVKSPWKRVNVIRSSDVDITIWNNEKECLSQTWDRSFIPTVELYLGLLTQLKWVCFSVVMKQYCFIIINDKLFSTKISGKWINKIDQLSCKMDKNSRNRWQILIRQRFISVQQQSYDPSVNQRTTRESPSHNYSNGTHRRYIIHTATICVVNEKKWEQESFSGSWKRLEREGSVKNDYAA